jgi:hypothetical protein
MRCTDRGIPAPDIPQWRRGSCKQYEAFNAHVPRPRPSIG